MIPTACARALVQLKGLCSGRLEWGSLSLLMMSHSLHHSVIDMAAAPPPSKSYQGHEFPGSRPPREGGGTGQREACQDGQHCWARQQVAELLGGRALRSYKGTLQPAQVPAPAPRLPLCGCGNTSVFCFRKPVHFSLPLFVPHFPSLAEAGSCYGRQALWAAHHS